MENWFPKNGLLKLQVNIMIVITMHIGGVNCCENEKPEDFIVLQEFLTSLKPEFTYKQYLGLKHMINLAEDDYWDYYSKGQIYNYEIDCNKLLDYLTNVCGYTFD